MKRLGIIGFGMLFVCHGAVAATSGFVDNAVCNEAMRYLACVEETALKYVEDHPQACDNGSEAWDESAAIQKVMASCSVSGTAAVAQDGMTGLGVRIAFENYYDNHCVGLTGNDSKAALTNEIAYGIAYLSQMGICSCRVGYYIQPRGLTRGAWGTNSACLQCPGNGTTSSEIALLPVACYLPAGSFSDEVGSGELANPCPYVLEGEQLWATFE